ncbi:hypothetical protein BASA83_005759 [Batrachochytrium salamandrivorans]|nr:hypothetical protein BASA83_005759 [Batrachochytrium salamandrivorans]
MEPDLPQSNHGNEFRPDDCHDHTMLEKVPAPHVPTTAGDSWKDHHWTADERSAMAQPAPRLKDCCGPDRREHSKSVKSRPAGTVLTNDKLRSASNEYLRLPDARSGITTPSGYLMPAVVVSGTAALKSVGGRLTTTTSAAVVLMSQWLQRSDPPPTRKHLLLLIEALSLQ